MAPFTGRQLQTRRLAAIEDQRRKLLDAYYANAINLPTLKAEQQRLDSDAHDATERLASLTAHLDQWRDILATALRFAGNCADAYRSAPDPIRKLYNAAVFTRISIRDGRVDGWDHHQPFDALLTASRFEYGSWVDLTFHNANTAVIVDGQPIGLPAQAAGPRQAGTATP